MRCARAWGAGLDLPAKNRLKALGGDDRVFISLSSSLATSLTEVPHIFHVFFPRPEPAA